MPISDLPIFNNPTQFMILTAWSLAWKGLALWRASRHNQKYWYIGLLVLNTIGIGEIIYLTWFAKKDRFWDKIVSQASWKKSKSSSTKNT